MPNKCETCGHEPLITKEEIESIVEQEREYLRNEPFVRERGDMRISVVDRVDRFNCRQAQVVVEGTFGKRVSTAWDSNAIEAVRKAVRHMFQTNGRELSGRHFLTEPDVT